MNFRDVRHVCLLLGLIVTLGSSEAFARKWTDTTGKFSVEADFVELVDGQIALRRTDGRVVRLPLERLSDADQRHAQTLAAPPGDESEPDDGATRTVVAEGVGLTPDEALKDAFRAAVRQVVGEVVDAETLVKDDQLVRDQVLTYSDAYIPKHTKVSERSEGGLFRVTIRAVVERRKLVVKLKAANVSVNDVDGQSVFGSIVSQLENEKDAAALLKAALEGFPKNCLEANVVGEPQVVQKDGEKATLRFQVQLRPDMNAYKSFAASLEKTLLAVTKEKGEFVLMFRQDSIPDTPQSEYFRLNGRIFEIYQLMPKAFTFSSGQSPQYRGYGNDVVTVAVATRISRSNQQIEFSYYVLDRSIQAPIFEVAFSQTHGRLTVLDACEETLTIDEFLFTEPQRGNHEPLSNADYDGCPIARLGPDYRDFRARSILLYDPAKAKRDDYNSVRSTAVRIFLIAPVFFGRREESSFLHKPSIRIDRDITLTLEEIKAIDKVTCEIDFGDSASQ